MEKNCGSTPTPAGKGKLGSLESYPCQAIRRHPKSHARVVTHKATREAGTFTLDGQSGAPVSVGSGEPCGEPDLPGPPSGNKVLLFPSHGGGIRRGPSPPPGGSKAISLWSQWRPHGSNNKAPRPPPHSRHSPHGEPKLPPQPAVTRCTSLSGVSGGGPRTWIPSPQ